MTKSTYHMTVTSLIQACSADEALLRSIVGKVAEQFVLVAREDLEERELVGADYANTFHGTDDECALHDFVDANMTMNEAFERMARDEVEDPELLPTVSDLVTGIGAEADLARSIWNSAWDVARKSGYSPLWARRGEMEENAFKALAAVLLARPGHVRLDDERYPTLPWWIDAVDELEAEATALLTGLDNISDLRPIADGVQEALRDEDEEKLVASLSQAERAPAP